MRAHPRGCAPLAPFKKPARRGGWASAYIGQMLESRYRIDALLGQGRMGAVYRVTNLRLGIPVALKEDLEATAEVKRQFGREAAILASLHHPNLPRVSDYFLIPDQGQDLVMGYSDSAGLAPGMRLRGRDGDRREGRCRLVGWAQAAACTGPTA